MLTNFDNLSFQILTVERSGHIPGHFKVTARPYASLSLRLDGYAKFLINGKELISRADDIVFIPAEVPYEVEYSRNTPNEIILVHLYPCNYPKEELIQRGEYTSSRPIFDSLLDAWRLQAINRAKSLIYSLFDILETERKTIKDSSDVVRFAKYFEERFSDSELSINEVCQHFYISRPKLQRMFLAHFGISPWQYLMKIRMNYALKLLCIGEMTVGEVALASGFSNKRHFSKTFRKIYGIPPSRVKGGHSV